MIQFFLISIGFLSVGLVIGALVLSAINKLVKDFVPISIVMLLFSLVFPLIGYTLSLVLDNNLFFYFSVLFSGILIVLPSLLLLNVYLLWWNPAKYKEYSMKKRRRERGLARSAEATVEDK